MPFTAASAGLYRHAPCPTASTRMPGGCLREGEGGASEPRPRAGGAGEDHRFYSQTFRMPVHLYSHIHMMVTHRCVTAYSHTHACARARARARAHTHTHTAVCTHTQATARTCPRPEELDADAAPSRARRGSGSGSGAGIFVGGPALDPAADASKAPCCLSGFVPAEEVVRVRLDGSLT